MFQVFDNNKPADENGYPGLKGNGWINSKSATFNEAADYAHQWLGAYGDGVELKLNTPYDYSGCGDMIEIREVV